MSFKIGLSRQNITPKLPVWMAGYGGKREAKSVIHDLWVKTMAIQDERGELVVIVTSDNQGFPRSSHDNVLAGVKERFGLEAHQVVVCFSHNHCGPRLGEDLKDYYPVDEEQEKVVAAYTRINEESIVSSVGESIADLKPAHLSVGYGKCRFAVNRRDNPEMQVAARLDRGEALNGVTDHCVPVIRVLDEQGALRAVLFAYSCHATSMFDHDEWCGDFPGFAQESLEAGHPDVMAMFIQGCGADQNPIPRRRRHLSERYGRMLAASVEEVLLQPMREIREGGVASVYHTCQLGYDKILSRDELKVIMEDDKRAEVHRRWAARTLAEYPADQPFEKTYPYPIQMLRISDLNFVFLGGEAVVDYVYRFREKFGDETWVCGYANQLVAYIPSNRVYAEGGYEGGAHIQEYGYHPAERWEEGVEDKIVATVDACAKKLSSS